MFDGVSELLKIRDAFRTDCPRVINSHATDAFIEYKHRFLSEACLSMCSSYDELKAHEDFALEDRRFWDERNSAMVSNIIARVHELPEIQTAAVMCGFEHRYALRDGLERSIPENEFDLREYWEI